MPLIKYLKEDLVLFIPKKNLIFFSMMIAEFSLAFLTLKKNPTYLILRGPIGFLATLICYLRNIYIIREIHVINSKN